MAKKLLTVTFREADDGEIEVSTKFAESIPVKRMFGLCGQAIHGLMLTCRSIGNANGMTDEAVDAAVFGKDESDVRESKSQEAR